MNLTWSVDAEFGWVGGDDYQLHPSRFVPVVFCAVCLETGCHRHFWGRDSGLARFLRRHGDDLFLSYNLLAEATYLLRLGIEPPPRWWDVMLAYRYVTNSGVVGPYRLETVLAEQTIPYRHSADEKEALREWIGGVGFDPDSPDDRRRIVEYCYDDCEGTGHLYRRLMTPPPKSG
jgi:hypothetical protein